jgi:hypothetical protein
MMFMPNGARSLRARQPSSSFRARAALLASLLASPLLAFAGDPPADEPADAAATSSQESGVRVYVDPATGRRTTRRPEGAAAPGANRPEFSQSSEGLVERPLPGGGTIVHLDGRFESSTRVKVGADGSRELYCTDPVHGSAPHGHDATSPAHREEQ